MATTLVTKVVDGAEDTLTTTITALNNAKRHRVAVSKGSGFVEVRYNGHADYIGVASLNGNMPGQSTFEMEAREDDVIRYTPTAPFQGRVTIEVLD